MGPKSNPAKAMTVSLASKVRKPTFIQEVRNIATYASAAKSAEKTIFWIVTAEFCRELIFDIKKSPFLWGEEKTIRVRKNTRYSSSFIQTLLSVKESHPVGAEYGVRRLILRKEPSEHQKCL